MTSLGNIVIKVHVFSPWGSSNCFRFTFVCPKAEHTVGVQWMLFGWRHKWWLTANTGAQDVNFFIGRTASVCILLTAKEMSPTVSNTATHCSSICAREARNLLLYMWEIHNRHSQRHALGLFTGLSDGFTCISFSHELPKITDLYAPLGRGRGAELRHRFGGEPTLGASSLASPRPHSSVSEAATQTLLLRAGGFWPKGFRSMSWRGVLLFPCTW